MAFVDPVPLMKTALRQTTRWLFAAKQDANPFVAMLHANYAVGNIDLIRQLWSDAEVVAATGHDITALAKDAAQMQDVVKRQLGVEL